jgi:hypothetical protein
MAFAYVSGFGHLCRVKALLDLSGGGTRLTENFARRVLQAASCVSKVLG